LRKKKAFFFLPPLEKTPQSIEKHFRNSTKNAFRKQYSSPERISNSSLNACSPEFYRAALIFNIFEKE